MTLSITDDEITSSVTTHRATRCPGGWAVTWLGDRTADRSGAVNAMLLAEAVADPSPYADEMIRSFAAELLLGMTLNEVKGLVALTSTPAVVHQAPVPDAGVVTCGDAGGETFLPGDVTCPACLELNGRPVLRDTHAIPARDAEGRDLCAKEDCDACGGTVTEQFPISEQVKRCPSCPHCGKTFHVEPTKTHDLSIVRVHGNVVIEAAAETDGRVVYLQDGVALDLGRVLAVLTAAQIAVLVEDLTGGGN